MKNLTLLFTLLLSLYHSQSLASLSSFSCKTRKPIAYGKTDSAPQSSLDPLADIDIQIRGSMILQKKLGGIKISVLNPDAEKPVIVVANNLRAEADPNYVPVGNPSNPYQRHNRFSYPLGCINLQQGSDECHTLNLLLPKNAGEDEDYFGELSITLGLSTKTVRVFCHAGGY